MAKVNKNKEVWEGWTVGAIYDDIKPFGDMIARGESWKKPFKDIKDVENWIKNDFPNFAKGAKDVAKLLAEDYGLSSRVIGKDR